MAISRTGLIARLFLVHVICTAHLRVLKQIDHSLWSVAVEFQIVLFSHH